MNQTRRRLVFLLLAAIVWLPLPQTALGGMEWTEVKEADLGIRPIQSVSSTDGKFVYLLIPGEVLVYSLAEDKVTNRVAVGVGYDRMAVSGSEAVLVLTSSQTGKMKILRGELILEIDIADHPLRGPADASVTVAVFDDYT